MTNTEKKNSGLAAILSFFVVGLGQIYNGQVIKGIMLFVGTFILCISVIGIIIAIPIWIWNVFDAASCARCVNGEKKTSIVGRLNAYTERTKTKTEDLKNSEDYKEKIAKNEKDFRWLVGDTIADKWIKL